MHLGLKLKNIQTLLWTSLINEHASYIYTLETCGQQQVTIIAMNIITDRTKVD